jgi:HK97 family phage major capsid protein
MTPIELRRKAADAREKISAIIKAAEKEDRELNDDETAAADDLRKQAESFERRAKVIEQADADIAATRTAPERTGTAVEVGATVEGRKTQEEKEESFGDFLRCIGTLADRSCPREVYERAHDRITNMYRSEYRAWGKNDRERRDLGQSSGTTGGYLVPSSLYGRLMSVAAESSIVRPNAMVLPMATDVVDVPILNQTTAPTAGNTAFYGGIKGAWSAEAASITETDATFRQAKLTAHELTGYTEVSRTLLQNSAISVDALLNQLFGGAIAWYEDYAFLRGDGIGKPLGVLEAPAVLASGTARGSATAITLANAAQVYAKVLASSRGNAVWVVSQGAIAAFLQMAGLANGVILPAGFVSTGNAPNTPAMSLMGRPVYFTEKMPTLNTAGDFGLYDFGQYIVGDRNALEIAVSEHFKFQNNQIAYRFVHRVGGMPWINSSITLADASTTNSPFVYLTIQ